MQLFPDEGGVGVLPPNIGFLTGITGADACGPEGEPFVEGRPPGRI